MKRINSGFDFCVVGGGLAGLIAGISAARRGAKVAIVQDRPIFGGNSSSEIRMHVCGAHGANMRETGIIEELCLENHYRNPTTNYSIWDSVLYGNARYQENLKIFLNASVSSCEMDGAKIKSVTAWQMTTETWHTIEASIFADCSGDGILAPLSGAEYRIGREAKAEFNETIPPDVADKKTMGMSCLMQAREHTTPKKFIAPDWAHKFTKPEDLHDRNVDIKHTNLWWMEVGGDNDSIHDSEELRDELLRISFGVWDYIKNYSDLKEKYANWVIDWQGFLPGKRESRRYIGDHILTQNDITAEGKFDDIVAYGGWSMDDHFPAGFYHPKAGTIFHPAPSPYGIPYRSLYSANVENLFCAGRCHSATHAAMSSTRVMCTTSLMGQAVGTAAALANKYQTTPRGVYENHIDELKQTLMDDDCYIPWNKREVSELTASASLKASSGTPENLRNGWNRQIGDEPNSWGAKLGDFVEYSFDEPQNVQEVRIVFDSNLDRVDEERNRGAKNMRNFYTLDAPDWKTPETLVKDFKIEVELASGNRKVFEIENNYQRLVKVPLDLQGAKSVRLVPLSTWGSGDVNVFELDVR
ncbi:MAG: FAD-dependent oxidoreductase [Kiritimatiellae bacterium]|jgi:mRNA-degrading endonuclease HigB of HigAB toxin-antitoxin module|nr:FAD-dependent oxidoreductase [Kiritimatiellia bacterium]